MIIRLIICFFAVIILWMMICFAWILLFESRSDNFSRGKAELKKNVSMEYVTRFG
ncbi:MAG: hypothetical protein HY064_15260 [Bacteroidetes bacterium]|nr:hypothetical protein [Bacteroidota bacterium]